ncbi:hypothetical protein SAICODRAFT_7083 [Saitoella complicata NRRL Y-17804]|nr:uncharacterized protein SAICODRAFT_7083 [Saitoella complicata NRRL Y-17804]ODQ53360.1 hypothetical protein SAICODRAFT_7083 [Saitoella complicata NRRL Y-17804]
MGGPSGAAQQPFPQAQPIIRFVSSTPISKTADVSCFLSTYISNANNDESSETKSSGGLIAQLERIRDDLEGIPWVKTELLQPLSGNAAEGDVAETTSEKRPLDVEDAPIDESKIDKDERKRLKKERREAERAKKGDDKEEEEEEL